MSESYLNITLVQCDLAWEQPDKNRQHLSDLIRQLPAETDLVVFPEMFATGFSMHVEHWAEPMDGETVSWMKQQAAEYHACIAGSLMIREGESFFNRFVFAHPDGRLDCYDKRHLFSMGEEHAHFKPGQQRKIIQIKSFRILPLVCYDLRFPVFNRNREDYDLLINTANWPATRREVWQTLLKARAIENQAYVAGVNRVGTDDSGIKYLGDTSLIDPKGKLIEVASEGQEECVSFRLAKGPLDRFRKSFPVLPDADDFHLAL